MKFHVAIVDPVIDLSVRSLCVKPYHNHPKGCPNYGQRAICPPQCGCFPYEYDNRYAVWALWTEFDIGAQVRRMRKKHPTWSYRQLSCCRYWQGTVRKFLRESIAKWKEEYPHLAVTICPEGMGVNVTATMHNIGVDLEWPPKKITRLVYLAGVLR